MTRHGNGFSSWVDHFFLTRPTLILVVWIFPLAGARGLDVPFLQMAALLFQYFCILGSAFIINQLHDQEGDAENGKCESLTRGLVSEESALRLSWILLIAGLVTALSLGLRNLLLTSLFFLLTAVFYNKPPIAAKDRPLAGPLLLAFSYAILVMQGAGLAGWFSLMVAFWTSAPIVAAGFAISLLTTIPDLEGDRKTGKRTFAVVFGVDRCWIAAAAAMALAALLALAGSDWTVGYPALASTLLMFHGLFTGPEVRAGKVARWSILLMGLALVPHHLWLAVLVPVYLLFARSYYRDRFDLSYPSL